jgi:hypothetical protein
MCVQKTHPFDEYMNGFGIYIYIAKLLKNYPLLVPSFDNYYKIKNMQVFNCWVWIANLKVQELKIELVS